MAAPVLFLEPASGHRQAVHPSDAIKTAKQFIQTLRQARRINTKISLNSTVPLSNCELAPGQTLQILFAGPEYRDAWFFLKELKTKTPFSDGFEQWLSKAELTEVKTSSGQLSVALTWANLLDTGTISFHVQPEWLTPWVSADCFVLDEKGDLNCQKRKIRNASAPTHVDEHLTWLKTLGYEQLPTAKQFWAERESRFPGLRFLSRVKTQIDDLATSGAPYKQAMSSLELLNNDALTWQSPSAPTFSAKVANGEHDQRRSLSKFHDELTDSEHEFDQHAYFTGGIAGRIHFRLANSENKFVVAYVGFKL
jgi:hypothetical protein